MPVARDKGDYRIPLALDNDEIERVAIAGSIGIGGAAVLTGECCFQGIEFEIFDLRAGIELLTADAGADKRRPWYRRYKIECFQTIFPGDHDVGIFNAGVELTIDEAGRRRMRRQNAWHLAFKEEAVTRPVCGK